MDSDVLDHIRSVEIRYKSVPIGDIPENDADIEWLHDWWNEHSESAIDYGVKAAQLTDYDIIRAQHMLNNGYAWSVIRNQMNISKGLIKYLIKVGELKEPANNEKVRIVTEKIKHDFNLKKIQELLDQGKSVDFIKLRTGISVYYLNKAEQFHLVDKTKWRDLRKIEKGKHNRHKRGSYKTEKANESGIKPFLFEWEKY